MTSKKKPRLTIGCRARILNKSSWREDIGAAEILLKERSSGGDFAVMVLGKGIKELEKEKSGVVVNEVAWVSEKDMELINRDFETNLDFMDWYDEHEEDFCPDCLGWFPNIGREDPKTGEDFKCPNKECPSNNPEDYGRL